MKDTTKFPSPIYQETVLAPIFDTFKAEYYSDMMSINYAHAAMLVEQGILTQEEGKQIILALKEIEEEIDLDSLEYTGEYEDLFFYVEKQLINRIGIETAGKLHTGRSRNDLNITLFKMKTKQYIRTLLNQLLYLQKTLLRLAEDNKDTIVVAYTHGQPAQPTTFGHYLGALIEILNRDFQRLLNAYHTTDRCSMGAAAITTSGFPLNRERMAELLGFAGPQENSYGCIAAVDYLLEVYSAVKILFINLGRFAQDLGFWTSFEVGHLYVPNEFVQTSSIMPQKRNPVAVEHIRVQASIVVGMCETVISALHNTPFTDMNDAEDPIQTVAFEALVRGERCLKLIAGFTGGLQVDEEKVHKHIGENFVTITELADSLVRAENISFRTAHEICSLLVRGLINRGLTLDKLDYDEFSVAFTEVTGRKPQINSAQLQEFLEPTHFVKVRNVYGGPGPQALSASLKRYKAQLHSYEEELEKLEQRQIEAADRLEAAISQILS